MSELFDFRVVKQGFYPSGIHAVIYQRSVLGWFAFSTIMEQQKRSIAGSQLRFSYQCIDTPECHPHISDPIGREISTLTFATPFQ